MRHVNSKWQVKLQLFPVCDYLVFVFYSVYILSVLFLTPILIPVCCNYVNFSSSVLPLKREKANVL